VDNVATIGWSMMAVGLALLAFGLALHWWR
jgi:hypothetical protein